MLQIFMGISFFQNSMKVNAAIAGGIALAIVIAAIAVLYTAGDNRDYAYFIIRYVY